MRFLLIALALLGGCMLNPPLQLINENHQAAERLMSTAAGRLDKASPVVVATLVNIDDLKKSSRLGRVVSEQIGGKLSQLGYTVIELKIRNEIFIKRSEGELLLSREVAEIVQNNKARAVLVGTYGPGANFVYINLKLVDPLTNYVMAAHDYSLPLTDDISAMLPPDAVKPNQNLGY